MLMHLPSFVSRSCRALQHGTNLARVPKSPNVNFNAQQFSKLHPRHFSSSSSGEEPPPEGFQGILATLAKVRARKDVFREYKQQDVFAPSSMSWLANCLMFYHLNRPHKTQLDLLEFLHGARYAMEATMMAMYSREFADYVAREAEAPGPLVPDCEAAEMVHRSLETVSYDAFKAFLLKSTAAGIRAEMKEVEVHSAHLLSVHFNLVARRPTTNALGAKVQGVPKEERLKLAVLFDITEHVNVTLPDSDGAEEVVARRNKAIWQFESNVTTPEDVDWIIEPLHLVA
ncbi:uncharacterized protein KRP23_9677 [Phytophthora ramorum]|nr:hypothetical protein KRP23_9677 [Phytophthora ramorum]